MEIDYVDMLINSMMYHKPYLRIQLDHVCETNGLNSIIFYSKVEAILDHFEDRIVASYAKDKAEDDWLRSIMSREDDSPESTINRISVPDIDDYKIDDLKCDGHVFHIYLSDIREVRLALISDGEASEATETAESTEIELDTVKEQVRLLYDLGVLDYLRTKYGKTLKVNNRLAILVGQILKKDRTTLQPYINAIMNDTASSKYPMKTPKTSVIVKELDAAELD